MTLLPDFACRAGRGVTAATVMPLPRCFGVSGMCTTGRAALGRRRPITPLEMGPCMVGRDVKEKRQGGVFDKSTKGEKPACLMDVTNNTEGEFNETTRKAYVALKMKGSNALLSQWTDSDGHRFGAAGLAVSGTSLKQALTFKIQPGQQEMLEVTGHEIRHT